MDHPQSQQVLVASSTSSDSLLAICPLSLFSLCLEVLTFMLGQKTFYPKFPILSFKYRHLDLMIWITYHLEFFLTVMTAFQMSIKAATIPLAITEIVLVVCLIILNQPRDLK